MRAKTLNDARLFKTLSEIFGFHAFRPYQEEIVRAILGGGDVFAVMPTGGGKSLCYQLPARMLNGVCVVVSPLISLMKDQVDAANANGLRAGTLNSTVTGVQAAEIGAALRRGEMDLLYISPERFNSEHFIERLKTLNISFFAIDEAHCISEWGHDFRPDYLALARIVDEFPDIPIAAFTATATPRVADDIVARLKLRKPHLTRASFNRPNLSYRIEAKTDLKKQLVGFFKQHQDESGIIYRTSRKNVELTAAVLQAEGFNARPYHAGMSDEDRGQTQEAFRRDECPIIVATIAFGMGIDKSNVRFVIHGDLPKNMEGYYQETGRAGRDGAPAQCVLFYGTQDYAQLIRFAEEIEDEQARAVAKEQLSQMIRFASHDGCRRAAILKYFGETYPEANCNSCDICNEEVQREEATVAAQKALSAMYRTGERFGAVHLADVLTGADTEKIRQFHHDHLPTYSVGKDQPKSYWRNVINALIAQGLAAVVDPNRPTPKITDEGWKVLRNQRPFQMLKQTLSKQSLIQAERQRTASTNTHSSVNMHPSDDAYSKELFQILRKLRTAIASEANVPPYIVFSDRTLQEMARDLPQTLDALLEINGVGQHKLENYGDQFLKAIKEFIQKKT